MSDTYKNNLEALKRHEKKYKELLEALPDTDISGIRQLQTKDGITYLFDDYCVSDPENANADAHAFWDTIELDSRKNVFLLGIGSGHILKHAFNGTTEVNMIVAIEKDVRIIKAVLHNIDLTAEIESDRFQLLGNLDLNLIDRWGHFLIDMALHGWTFIPHPSSYKLNGDYYNALVAKVNQLVHLEAMAGRTSYLYSAEFTEHIFANAKRYIENPGINELKNKFKDIPAFVVGSGPSLNKLFEGLQMARSKGLIIACDTALKPLLKNGVQPDITNVLDFHDGNERCFEGIEYSNEPGLLVSNPKVTPAVFDHWPGPVSFYYEPSSALNYLAEGAGQKGGLHHSICVGHQAFAVADYLGCNPIILVGQDMAWKNRRRYVEGTPFEDTYRKMAEKEGRKFEDVMKEHEDRELNNKVKVPGYNGTEVETEPRLQSYLNRLNVMIKASGKRVIDTATEGAAKQGVEVLGLSKVFDILPVIDVPRGTINEPGEIRTDNNIDIAAKFAVLKDDMGIVSLASLRWYHAIMAAHHQYSHNPKIDPRKDFVLTNIMNLCREILRQLKGPSMNILNEFASKYIYIIGSRSLRFRQLKERGGTDLAWGFLSDAHHTRETAMAAADLLNLLEKYA